MLRRHVIMLCVAGMLLLMGCGVWASASPTPTPTPTLPIWVVITVAPEPTATPTRTPTPEPTPYPTYTPLPTSTAMPTYTPYPTYTPVPSNTPTPTIMPTETPTVTPTMTPSPTPTPLPLLREPDTSAIWSELELYGLMEAFKGNPRRVLDKYRGQSVTVKGPLSYNIRNEVWLSWAYTYGDSLEHNFSVLCLIEEVKDRHIPVLKQIQGFWDKDTSAMLHVHGTIRKRYANIAAFDTAAGGLRFRIFLRDCDVIGIGSQIQSTS